MTKKILLGFLTVVVMTAIAGCSSLPFLNSSKNANQNSQNPFNSDPSTLPIQMKLGIGTLKLEDTNQAITVDQAKTLLPLWKALKQLSSNTNTTPEEIAALNLQIKDAMTAEQIQAIEKMTWNSGDVRGLAQKFGLQFGQGGSQNNTPGQTSTRTASSRTQNGGGGFPGGGPGGPPGGGGFGFSNNNANGTRTATQRTPVPGQAARRTAGGMNLLFADPVIKLLENKIKTG
jgi:hypothetical protein